MKAKNLKEEVDRIRAMHEAGTYITETFRKHAEETGFAPEDFETDSLIEHVQTLLLRIEELEHPELPGPMKRIVEIVDPLGNVSYRRPEGHDLVREVQDLIEKGSIWYSLRYQDNGEVIAGPSPEMAQRLEDLREKLQEGIG